MSSSIWVGAVAYDPKVVTIWEGMRRYFVEEAKLPVDIVLFQSYEAQVSALLAQPGDGIPRIDIGWNTNLAFVQAVTQRQCVPADRHAGHRYWLDDQDCRRDRRPDHVTWRPSRPHARAGQP